ncbi:hypothetical protein EJB05_00436, partial [Eragrostis curvula]
MAKRKNLEDAVGKAAATVDDAAAKAKNINLDDATSTAAANVNDKVGTPAANVDDATAMATTKHEVLFNNTTINTMVTKSYEAGYDWIQEVRGDHREHLVVGLDTEWRAVYWPGEGIKRMQTALIQLCVGSRCLVYQIHHANNVYPKILKDFLECPHCKFIGADVKQDTTRLENDYGIFVRNAVDLQPIGISMGIGTKRWRPSLEKLAKRLLLADMDKKNKDFLHATWDREDLTPEHIAYAAIDAFASAELAKPMNIKVDNLV